jgi:CubicO group peptidase (beta-lactamase class C family)
MKSLPLDRCRPVIFAFVLALGATLAACARAQIRPPAELPLPRVLVTPQADPTSTELAADLQTRPTSTPAPTSAASTAPHPRRTRTPAPKVLVTPYPSPAYPPDLTAYVDDLAHKENFRGVVMVLENGRPILEREYGLADEEQNLPNRMDTGFRIASLTKAFTAELIMDLEAEGKLSFNDPICKYFSPCPPVFASITIQHLLTHSSGISDSVAESTEPSAAKPDGSSGLPTGEAYDPAVAAYAHRALLFTPGASFNYSNQNYILLGDLIQRITGVSYAEFLDEVILTPLRLHHTGYQAVPQQLAAGYLSPGKLALDFNPNELSSAGGLYSSALDLTHWAQVLLNGNLLPAGKQARMFTSFVDEPDRPGTSYGYGWRITTRLNQRLYYHDGAIDGYRSTIEIYPSRNLIQVVLTNDTSVNPRIISLPLSNHLLTGN